ncbi:MAG: XrtA-associated tyrosine autokinase [Alphaproteobacteria bacterium]
MNIIEKAVERLNAPRKASLVEKAAEQLAASSHSVDETGSGDGKTPLAAAEPAPQARVSKRVIIDFEKLRAAGFVVPNDKRTRIGEEFRMIKRPLLLKAFRRGPDAIDNGHLIMLTSAKAGEGKTFTSVSLAMSIASERDLTVLLVDADICNPAILQTLGIQDRNPPGLVDLIESGDRDVADIMLRTNQENLSIIPAGHPHAYATELLASDRMARFVQDIAKRYSDRVIIFDSAPLLVSSEPSVLALHVGQIVCVVEAEKTGRAEVRSALNFISACKNVGLVLNKSRSRIKSEDFGTYYNDER